MGSYMNFKNFSDTILQPEGNNGLKPEGNFSLARQSSVFSLTFDEFQSSLGGNGKDFGSMNMDEFLKNIWTAEETQALASSIGVAAERNNNNNNNTPGAGAGAGAGAGGNLQRQGSLTLPRTISQKTVDEVWRDMFKESGAVKDVSVSGGTNVPQREPTLGEMTLEEFLARAGVVREDPQPMPNNGGFYAEVQQQQQQQQQPSNNNNGFTFGFQQSAQNIGVLANQNTQNNSLVPNQSPSLAFNVGGVRSSQPQPLFPKQTTLAFVSPTHLVNNAQLASPRQLDPTGNNGLFQGGVIQNGAMAMSGLSSVVTTITARSPVNQLTSDVTAKSNGNTSSVSPLPCMFSNGVRGRKCGGALEKVQERRHKRMIKNRESAARSRARKQAYTLELEAEIAELKEVNEELQKKQAEMMEMQKNQIPETEKMPWGSKRPCLRRTLTGPW